MATRRCRIVFCTPATMAGGAEKHMLVLAAACKVWGHEIHAVYQECAALEGVTLECRSAGAVYWPAAIGWNEAAPVEVNAARQSKEFGRTLDMIQPDLVVVSLPWPTKGMGLLPACADHGIPALVTFHLSDKDLAMPEDEAANLRVAHGGGQIWTAVSPVVGKAVAAAVGIDPSALIHIPNGTKVPPPRSDADVAAGRALIRTRLGFDRHALLVLTVGRLDHHKGHADLIAAMPDILAQVPQAKFVWLGDGEARFALEAAGRRQSADGDHLRLLGQVENPSEYYWAADVFVLPSYLEGHSLALLEAAAHGCPIVTTRTGGDGAMLRHGRDAMVYVEGDITALGRRVVDLLADRGLAARLSNAGWAWANEHSEARMLDQYQRMIDAIVLSPAHRDAHAQ